MPDRRRLLLAAIAVPSLSPAAQRTMELPPFDAIEAGAAITLRLRQTQGSRLTLHGDEGRLGDIKAVVRDGTLRIEQRDSGRKLRIDVDVWKLARISVDDSARVEADALAAKSLKLKVDGSGVLRLRALTAEMLQIALDGSGMLRAAGRANEMDLDVDGAAVAELEQLVVRRVRVAVDGAGQAGIHASTRLSGSVGGAGSLRYRGGAAAELAKSGAARVRAV